MWTHPKIWCGLRTPDEATELSESSRCKPTSPGNTGHVSFALSQTVTTKSRGCQINSSMDLEPWCEMSMPISFMTAMASGARALASC